MDGTLGQHIFQAILTLLAVTIGPITLVFFGIITLLTIAEMILELEYKIKYTKKLKNFEKEFEIRLEEKKLKKKLKIEANYREEVNITIMEAVNGRRMIDEKEKNIIKKKIEIMNSIINKEDATKIELRAIRKQAEILKKEIKDGLYYSKIGHQPNERILEKVKEVEEFLNRQNIEEIKNKEDQYLKSILFFREENLEKYAEVEQIEKMRKIVEYRNKQLNENKEMPIIEDIYGKMVNYAHHIIRKMSKEKEENKKRKKEEQEREEKEIIEKIAKKIQSVE